MNFIASCRLAGDQIPGEIIALRSTSGKVEELASQLPTNVRALGTVLNVGDLPPLHFPICQIVFSVIRSMYRGRLGTLNES